jgi:putative hydroxymethylpyrimidine transport system permease protein
MATLLRTCAATLLILAIWQGIIWATDLPKFLLPSPVQVLSALWSNKESIAWHASVTTSEVLLGLLLGAALGAITAIQLAASPMARYFIKPILVLTQALPVFALAPILTLWLGYGLWSKIVMAVLIIYFPVASAFFDGLMRTQPGWMDLGRVMGARPHQLLWRIRIPAAIPALGSGLRLAAVYAPIGAVIGEWVGASQGLGYLMLLANGRVKTDLMFAALLVLAVLTLILHRGVGVLVDRLQARYS